MKVELGWELTATFLIARTAAGLLRICPEGVFDELARIADIREFVELVLLDDTMVVSILLGLLGAMKRQVQ